MRAFTSADLDFVYGLATNEPTASRWRFGGRTPTTQHFTAALELGVASHWVFVSRRRDQRLGYASLYNYDSIDGVGYFAIVLAPEVWVSAQSFDCIITSIDYVFRYWDVRLLYGELNEYNYVSIASGDGRWFRRIGCLRAHQYVGGAFADVLLIELERAAWRRTIQRYRGFLHRGDAAGVT